MRALQWSALKNKRLKKVRGVSFEEITKAKLVDNKEHPTRPHQNVLLCEYQGYIWVVPYVQSEEAIFLKTLYRSRKYTKLYRKGGLT